MNAPDNTEKRESPNLPRSLVREGLQVISHDLLESDFQPEDTGRKLMLLLDLKNVNTLMDDGGEIDQMLNMGMRVAARNTGAHFVCLLLKDAATCEWTTAAGHGSLEPSVISVCQHIIKTDCHDLFTSRKTLVPCSERLTINGQKAVFLCLPVMADSRLAGCIMFIRKGDGPFGLKEITLASMINQWCSVKLTNEGLLRELQVQREHEQKLLAKICQSQIEERRRVAGELHDTIAQWLVSAAYDVGVCQIVAARTPDPVIGQELEKVKNSLQRSIEEVRRIIANLRPPPIVDLGLIGAINQTAQGLNKEGIECRVRICGELPKLSMAEENTIFWIVQESINNIRKHAAATSVSIEFKRLGDTLRLEISDNGRGFDVDKVLSSSTPLLRVGLSGLKERAELLGGTLSVTSGPSSGTSIELAFETNPNFSFQVAAA
jgi:signal transduction histidine kinase